MADDPRPAATSRSQDVRVRNTAVVLRSLREHGGASRADLAARTGLAKGTVGTIVAELVDAGAVAESASAPGGSRGRPSRPVTLDGTDLVGVGLEVNVDYRSLVAMDLAGTVRLVVDDVPGGTSGGGAAADVGDFAARCLDRVREAGLRPLGVGLAVPGLVEQDRRTVRDAPNLHWNGVDLAAAVESRTCGLRASVDNDANCAVRAEASVGAAAGASDVLYVTGTVGVGGGVLASHDVLLGRQGFAGEIGHLPLGSPEHVCACGRRGCWETVVGLAALLRLTGVRGTRGAGPLDVAAQVADALPSDAGARRGVDRLAGDLARGCALLATVLDPGVIVLGGWYAVLAPWLTPVVQAHLDTEVLGGGCAVVPSTLGLRAAATGAAAGVVDDVLDARVPVGTVVVGPEPSEAVGAGR